MLSGSYWISLLILFLLSGILSCATSPTGRSQLQLVSADQMSSMGTAAFDDMKKTQPISRDAKIDAYVRCVANEITAVLPEKQNWEVVVFENVEPNAFALPGGKIGVHTGMLKVAENAAQLAAVLGHEVGHVLANHSNERVSEAQILEGGTALASALFKNKESRTYGVAMAVLGVGAQFGVVLPHSRTQETEADIVGMRLMSQAGFDPQASVQLWKNMSKAGGGQTPQFLSTHPSNETRIQTLEQNMTQAVATYRQVSRRPSCQL